MSGFKEFSKKENELIDEHADILKWFAGTALSKNECLNIFADFLADVNEANGVNTSNEQALPLHGVSNNEGLESREGVAVKGCHNCKNNPHAPFVPEICDSCYADSFNNWQQLTDC